jgi:Domain of unknown function (DUF4189)
MRYPRFISRKEDDMTTQHRRVIKKILVSAAIALGSSVGAAAPASADPNAIGGTGDAAIAYSPSTGKFETVWDASDEQIAVDDAVANCNRNAGTTDCAAVVTSDGCVSLAAVPGDARKFLGGWGTSLAEADAHALQGLPGGIILDHECNDEPSWGNGTVY